MNIKIYNKEGKYGFQSNRIKVEFSNPQIQSFDENSYCKSDKDIMYYYYTVTVFIKENKKWKNFFTVYPYDFPEIITFKNILKIFLDDVNIETYQKDTCETGTWYTYSLDTGKLGEDVYSVSHSLLKTDEGTKSNYYNVMIGKSFDYYADNYINIGLSDLNKGNLRDIYTCVSDFIQYSIDKNNEIVIKRNKDALSSWKVEDGKLYKMKEDGKSIESIFIVGDVIDDAVILRGDINTNEFSSYKITKFIIDEIKEDAIILSSGFEEISGEYRKIENSEEIKLSSLLSLFEDMSDERLSFTEEQIIEDFKSILSENEKKEFIEKSVNYLFDKWNSAIIDRTWMCREEHNLPQRVKDKGNHENVYASIRVIIEKIQNDLKG